MFFLVVNRKEEIEVFLNIYFDLLVIGGGVIGCGIVLDVVLRGMSVVLVEKCDFVLGMSSKFIKLIYGGLCYLK